MQNAGYWTQSILQSIQLIILRLQKTSCHLTLGWVKAHVGIEGNERADTLAKAATNNQQPIQTRQPITYVKNKIQLYAIKTWQEEWNSHHNGRYTYDLLPKVYNSPPVKSAGQTAFLTNHGPFPAYLYRFAKLPSSLCACGQEGTSLHYATACPITQPFHIAKLTQNNKKLWTTHLLSNKSVIAKIQSLFSWLQTNQYLIESTQ